MGECVFCDIVAKQAPASVVYEDDSTLGLWTSTLQPLVMS
jgi:diadenosine tetraphosphate (Ap4A) HIT family hydrolase